MANFIRVCILFGLCATVDAKTLTTSEAATCSINGVAAADELVNSILFIWQAAGRCGKTNSAACSVDVNSAIESMTGMINVILKAIDRCGDALQGMHAQCGMAAGEVTQALAGIAAKSSGIHEHCKKDDIKPVDGLKEEFLVGTNHLTPKLAHCVVDIKSLTFSILKAALGFSTVKTNCDASTGACVANSLYIVVSMAEMGEYIAGVVGHCSEPTNHQAACASDIMGLLHSLTHLSAAGNDMAKACSLSEGERLYLENGGDFAKAQGVANSPSVTLGLAVLLPLAAVLSFVGGRRMASYERALRQDTLMMAAGTE